MSEVEQDLDIAIGHYAELLASNLHAQRAAHFPPDAKKVMRTLTSGEAAELALPSWVIVGAKGGEA
ncbi:hypothetical protein [Paracoccus aminovorans]|uniref:hypothetical protein n=1 Tax=Paracoccus aminovorans TaxID=34004 RepID=UPI0009E91A5E|nr:hypothetical protein [Paracoccus aminovorans]